LTSQQSSHPTYVQSLGAIGRYLDQHGYHSLVLCELGDGFVVRAIRGENLPEAIPFPMTDMFNLIRLANERTSRTKPLAPTPQDPLASFVRRVVGGYYEFLSALGQQCDQTDAASLMVMELADSVLLSYQKTLTTYDAWDSSTYEYLYNEQGARKLIMGSAPSLRR